MAGDGADTGAVTRCRGGFHCDSEWIVGDAFAREPTQFAPVVLLVGEFVKILLSVGLLWLAYRWIEGLSWGALIVGVILALKALLLTPWAQRAVDRWQADKAVR